MVTWRRLSTFQGKKIPLWHHRSNVDISQQAGTERLDSPQYWILLTRPHDKGSEFTHAHTELLILAFCMGTSKSWCQIHRKRLLLSWEHWTTQSPQGLFLQLLPNGVTEPHWISVMREKLLKKPNSELHTILMPEIILYFKVCMQSYFLLLHNLWGDTGLLLFPCLSHILWFLGTECI